MLIAIILINKIEKNTRKAKIRYLNVIKKTTLIVLKY